MGPLTEDQTLYQSAWESDLIQKSAEVDHWLEVVEEKKAAGEKVWGPDDFTKGDLVRYSGYWMDVLRVNKKTLTVPNFVIEGYTTTVKYDGVQGRMSAAEAAESRAASAAAKSAQAIEPEETEKPS